MIRKSELLIVFDLDGTILSTNSFHEFLIFEFMHSDWWSRVRILAAIVLRKCRLLSSVRLKNIVLSRHKFKRIEDMRDYFGEFYSTLVPYYDHTITSVIRAYLRLNYEVIIITGALYDYAVYVAEELKVDGLVATTLKYDNARFAGTIEGREILGRQKMEYLADGQHKEKKVIAYSDSMLDKPLLEYAYKAYRVSLKENNHKIRFFRKKC